MGSVHFLCDNLLGLETLITLHIQFQKAKLADYRDLVGKNIYIYTHTHTHTHTHSYLWVNLAEKGSKIKKFLYSQIYSTQTVASKEISERQTPVN